MATAQLREIIYDDTSPRPVLANFSEGCLEKNTEHKFSGALFLDKHRNHVAAVTSGQSLYVSKINKEKDPYNNFLLIRDKKTATCRLVAVDNVLYSTSVQVKENTASLKRKSSVSTVADLVKEFGSKKSRRITLQNQQTKTDTEKTDVKFEKVAQEIEIVEDASPLQSQEMASLYTPPINRSALKVEDVYPISILLPEECLDELKTVANESLLKEEMSVTSEYVKKKMLHLKTSNLSNKEFKCQLLLYIECLLGFIKQPVRTIGSRKYSPCTYSSKLSQHILNNFTITTPSGRARPISIRDKCICYILVLSMLASDYQTSLESLAADTKTGIKKLKDLSKVLGFTVNAKDKNTVMLKLPLPPAPSFQPNRKRK